MEREIPKCEKHIGKIFDGDDRVKVEPKIVTDFIESGRLIFNLPSQYFGRYLHTQVACVDVDSNIECSHFRVHSFSSTSINEHFRLPIPFNGRYMSSELVIQMDPDMINFRQLELELFLHGKCVDVKSVPNIDKKVHIWIYLFMDRY